MSRRCMPSEWPRQTVTALIARKTASAPQVKKIGAPTRPTIVIVEIQADFTGFQWTAPAMALVASASIIRGERNVLSDRLRASSTASNSALPAAAHIAMALLHAIHTL